MSNQDVLVLAETRGDALADVTFELLAAGRELARAIGGAVLAVVLGPNGASHAGGLQAVDRIITVDDPALADYSPEPFVAALREVVDVEQPRAVLIAASSIGWDVAPLLAARMNAPMATGCQTVRPDGDGLLVTTSFCGGKMTADCRIVASPAVLMMMPGSHRPTDETGRGELEQRTPVAPLETGAVSFEEWIYPEAGDVDITQHDILVAVGRGIQQQDNIELAEELAEALGGAVCASRPGLRQPTGLMRGGSPSSGWTSASGSASGRNVERRKSTASPPAGRCFPPPFGRRSDTPWPKSSPRCRSIRSV